MRRAPRSTLFPYTTLFRSGRCCPLGRGMNERDQLIRPIFVICVSNQLYKEIAEITAPSSVGDSTTLVRGRRLGVRRVRRVLLDATNEIERGVKRLVVLRIRRDTHPAQTRLKSGSSRPTLTRTSPF